MIGTEARQARANRARSALAERWAVVCLSHLPWQETLLQRPHHWMRRFGAICPTLWLAPASWRRFTPLVAADDRLARRPATPAGVTIRQLAYTPWSGRAEWALDSTARRLAAAARRWRSSLTPAADGRPRRVVAWVQYPLLGGAAARLTPDFLAADIMDPYRLFAGHLRTGSRAADACLRHAGVVFAGGRTMGADAARTLGREVVTIPSGVDLAHFRSACGKRLRFPNMALQLCFGYCGSIDERLDFPLLVQLARDFPNVRFELVGPVRCALPTPLPVNIACPGGVAYDRLPDVMAGWTAALLPFHDDTLCRELSPTKVPEYLAAGLPVVATPLPDVVSEWGDCVTTARDAADWARALGDVLRGEARPAPTEARLAEADWDARFGEVLSALADLV